MRNKKGRGFGLALVACVAVTILSGCSTSGYTQLNQQKGPSVPTDCKGSAAYDRLCLWAYDKTTDGLTKQAARLKLSNLWLPRDSAGLEGVSGIAQYGTSCIVMVSDEPMGRLTAAIGYRSTRISGDGVLFVANHTDETGLKGLMKLAATKCTPPTSATPVPSVSASAA